MSFNKVSYSTKPPKSFVDMKIVGLVLAAILIVIQFFVIGSLKAKITKLEKDIKTVVTQESLLPSTETQASTEQELTTQAPASTEDALSEEPVTQENVTEDEVSQENVTQENTTEEALPAQDFVYLDLFNQFVAQINAYNLSGGCSLYLPELIQVRFNEYLKSVDASTEEDFWVKMKAAYGEDVSLVATAKQVYACNEADRTMILDALALRGAVYQTDEMVCVLYDEAYQSQQSSVPFQECICFCNIGGVWYIAGPVDPATLTTEEIITF